MAEEHNSGRVLVLVLALESVLESVLVLALVLALVSVLVSALESDPYPQTHRRQCHRPNPVVVKYHADRGY